MKWAMAVRLKEILENNPKLYIDIGSRPWSKILRKYYEFLTMCLRSMLCINILPMAVSNILRKYYDY